MSPDKLRYMANQIATFFASQPKTKPSTASPTTSTSSGIRACVLNFLKLADESIEGFKPMVVAALSAVNRPEKAETPN
jgi:formate dehydrogenase subunit delta